VTVTNVSDDGHEVLNGKTVYEFITPETGVPQRDGAATPFVKVRLVMERRVAGSGGVTVRFRNQAGTNIGPMATLSPRPAPHDNQYYFQSVDAAMPYLGARSVQITYSPSTGGSVSAVVPLADNQVIREYSDLELTAYFDSEPATDIFRAAVSDIQSSPFTPILVRNTAIGDLSTAYTDYTAFLGRARTTEYYRWIPETPGERNDTRDDQNLTQYKLLQADTVIYSSVAPSGDDRFYAEGQARRLKIGQDEERWEYMRKIHCTDLSMANATFTDNCDFADKESRYAGYKGIEVTVDSSKNYAPKQMSYNRAPAFIVETISKSGFNNSTGPDDYMVTRVTNHRFDPITGTPTLSVAHQGRAGHYVPAKATRGTPAYLVNTPLARTMFERNMLNPMFREDAYTWTVAPTAGDVASGAFINFDTDDLSSASLLPPRLTRVKVTPFTQQYLNYSGAPAPAPVTSWHNPILGMGEFTPRFKLTDAAGQALLADNVALFTPSFLDGTFLRQWDGVEIEAVNRYLKPLGKKDVYGIRSAHRYDPSGFHQIGVFANAGYKETALLTAEGRAGNFPDQSLADGWRYTGGSPAVSGNFIQLTGNFALSHSLDLNAGQSYLVEAQIHSSADRTCQAAFYTDAGGAGDAKPVAVKAGLHAYQVVLGATGYATIPGSGLNRLRLSCNDNVAGVVKVAYLRAYPERAETISYLYDVRGNMVQSVNEQNVSSYYDYDASGNLAAIRNDDGILFSTHKRELTNVATP
jgi:YD repeat-containing protein